MKRKRSKAQQECNKPGFVFWISGAACVCLLMSCSGSTKSPLPQKTSPIATNRTEQVLDRDTGTWKKNGKFMVKPLHREPRDLEYPEVTVKPKKR